MYVVPAHHKDDKWSSTPYKPCTVKLPYYQPQTHPNGFRLVREDQSQFNMQQFQMPLLGTTSETGSPVPLVGVSKNDANAKMNLLQCESNSSIILELGKTTPDYSLGVNLNSEDKFCKDDEKTFLSWVLKLTRKPKILTSPVKRISVLVNWFKYFSKLESKEIATRPRLNSRIIVTPFLT